MVKLAKGWARNEQVGSWSRLRCGVRRSRRSGVAVPVGDGQLRELVVGAAAVCGGREVSNGSAAGAGEAPGAGGAAAVFVEVEPGWKGHCFA
jgi:hypothetical protein